MYFESSSRERSNKEGYCEKRSSAKRAELCKASGAPEETPGRGKTTGLRVQELFIGLVADTEQRLGSCSLRFKALTVSHIERMEDPHIMCSYPGPNWGDSHTLSLHSPWSARGMVRL